MRSLFALAALVLAAALPTRAQPLPAPPVFVVDSLAGQHVGRRLVDPLARADAPGPDGRVAVAFDVPLHGNQVFSAFFERANRADTVALRLERAGEEVCASPGYVCSDLQQAPGTVRVTLRARPGTRGTLWLQAAAPRQYVARRTTLQRGQPVRLDRVHGGASYVRAYAFVPTPGRPLHLYAEADSANVDLRFMSFKGLREGADPGEAFVVRAGQAGRERTWVDGRVLGDTAVVLATSSVRDRAAQALLVLSGLDTTRAFGWVAAGEVRHWIWADAAADAAAEPVPLPCDTATADLVAGRVGGVPVGATTEQAAALTCPRGDTDTRGPMGTGLDEGSWFVFSHFNGRVTPDLFGLSEAEAQRVLAEEGLGAPAVVVPGRGLRYTMPYGCLSLALGQEGVIMALMRPTACNLPDD